MVRLEPFSTRHLTATYVAWLNDPAVVRYSEQRHRKHTLDSCRAYVGRFESGPDRLWAVEYEGEHVGNISAVVDLMNGTVEVSNLIGEPSVWGRGIGTESVRQAVNSMLDEGYRKVWLGTVSCNAAELRLMDKLGLELDCVIRGHFLIDGKPVDEIRKCVFAPRRV
jgi:[ribosomal protein S5]-alanine N-acetyltransferase